MNAGDMAQGFTDTGTQLGDFDYNVFGECNKRLIRKV